MLGLTVTPAEVWQSPDSDAIYKGFDPNLVYVPKEDTRTMTVSPNVIEMNASQGSAPGAILATTPVQKFRTSVDVTVDENQGAVTPFRIGLWSPWSTAGSFVVFGP